MMSNSIRKRLDVCINCLMLMYPQEFKPETLLREIPDKLVKLGIDVKGSDSLETSVPKIEEFIEKTKLK